MKRLLPVLAVLVPLATPAAAQDLEKGKEAHMWLNIAAAQGLMEANALRADLARDMTAAQIADAQRLARERWESRNP